MIEVMAALADTLVQRESLAANSLRARAVIALSELNSIPMIAMWSSNVTLLLSATFGGIALIPISASALVRHNRQFWLLALGLAVAAGALNVARVLAHQSDPANNILIRDISAIAVLAFACPIVSASFAVGLAQTSALVRLAVATAVVAAFVFVAPWFLLIAHCTSGDCL